MSSTTETVAELTEREGPEEWPECPACEDPTCRPGFDEPPCDWCNGKRFLDGDDLREYGWGDDPYEAAKRFQAWLDAGMPDNRSQTLTPCAAPGT